MQRRTRRPKKQELLLKARFLDILHVKEVLGHVSIQNTLIYIHLENALFKNVDDEFHVRIAKTPEEVTQLLEVGFEYVTDMDGLKFFRKRK